MRKHKHTRGVTKMKRRENATEFSGEIVDLLWELRELAPEQKVSIDGGSTWYDFSLQDANIYVDGYGTIVFDIEP